MWMIGFPFGTLRWDAKEHRANMPMRVFFGNAAGGLTEADISAFSQPIPDKFWSKMGRKMSTQRQSRPAQAGYKANVQSWFHDDEGTVSSTGLSSPKPSKKDFEEEVSLVYLFCLIGQACRRVF